MATMDFGVKIIYAHNDVNFCHRMDLFLAFQVFDYFSSRDSRSFEWDQILRWEKLKILQSKLAWSIFRSFPNVDGFKWDFHSLLKNVLLRFRLDEGAVREKFTFNLVENNHTFFQLTLIHPFHWIWVTQNQHDNMYSLFSWHIFPPSSLTLS